METERVQQHQHEPDNVVNSIIATHHHHHHKHYYRTNCIKRNQWRHPHTLHVEKLVAQDYKMHPTRQQSIINELSGHASLLLASASPTIISSPLQNNTNNTSTSSNNLIATTTNSRAHSPSGNSTSNVAAKDNASSHASYCSDDELPEDNSINFKKPQNEIFKKLDGKIQRIVAAHSNLNKLYALNDFTSVGPRKPFELPAPLPRPPPWVPKVSSDYGCSQWAEETLNNLNRVAANEDVEFSDIRQSVSIPGSNRVTRILLKGNTMPPTKPPTPTIDSAISRLHQRRQQQQQQQNQPVQTLTIKPLPPSHQQHKFQVPQPQPRISQQAQRIHQINLKAGTNQSPQSIARSLFPSTSRSPNQQLAQFNSKDLDALNALIQVQRQQQNNQLHRQEQQSQHTNQQNNQQPKESTGPTSIRPNLTPEERKKFQMELINIFRQEIAAMTKVAKLKISSPQAGERAKTAEQKSLLLKKSPQSLFNTIRRETSLLLNRGDLPNNRSGVSLLGAQQSSSGHRLRYGHDNQVMTYRPNRYHAVKVVAPPTEFFKHACGKQPSGKGSSENIDCNCLESKAQILNVDQWCPPRQFSLKYRNLQMKLYQLKYIQKRDELNRKRGVTISMLPADARKTKANPQKSLDKIVDRLQARCLSTSSSCRSNSPAGGQNSSQAKSNDSATERSAEPTPSVSPKVSQQAHDITYSPPMSPKPIPVFRPMSPNKGGYTTASGSVLSASNKNASLKMKKAKRLHHFGLRLNNFMDKDNPQPTTEKISVEQFAKCLNLVRTNDASLRRHQEKLLQSEQKWRTPLGDRPLRLRRIRGERMQMPPSASYRATRRVGLQ